MILSFLKGKPWPKSIPAATRVTSDGRVRMDHARAGGRPPLSRTRFSLLWMLLVKYTHETNVEPIYYVRVTMKNSIYAKVWV